MFFTVALGQTSSMAIPDIIPCGKSLHIYINGNAKSSWFERKKVLLNDASSIFVSVKS